MRGCWPLNGTAARCHPPERAALSDWPGEIRTSVNRAMSALCLAWCLRRPFALWPDTTTMLTERQRTLVRENWAMVAPISDTAAALFYQRLFQLDPSLHALFAHADMSAQGKKLMQMLDVAVAQLDRLDTLAPAVAALGKRHVNYGVRAEHYATVGAALLWTLEHGLGDAFTSEAREAWTATYGVLSEAMQSPGAEALQGAA